MQCRSIFKDFKTTIDSVGYFYIIKYMYNMMWLYTYLTNLPREQQFLLAMFLNTAHRLFLSRAFTTNGLKC